METNPEFRKIKSLKFLYEVNEDGTIFRNVKSKKQSKIKLDYHHSKTGYYTAFVHLNGRRLDEKTIRVAIHRVVAECWLGDCPEGMEVDHIDRNSHNNHYTNLRYVTKSEQMKNRDHTNISALGRKNLLAASENRCKPVKIIKDCKEYYFKSFTECSNYLANVYNKTQHQIKWKLKAKRKHIYDYDIIYLNAETGHGSSTEQGTVR